MTISGWVIYFLILAVIGFCVFCIYDSCFTSRDRILTVAIAVAIAVLLLVGMHWFFGNTASGQRMLIDERSELRQGIERVVTVYTADGKILAQYEGKIDLEQNDGGYVKFDLNGKRYIYYNCFVESIADIEN